MHRTGIVAWAAVLASVAAPACSNAEPPLSTTASVASASTAGMTGSVTTSTRVPATGATATVGTPGSSSPPSMSVSPGTPAPTVPSPTTTGAIASFTIPLTATPDGIEGLPFGTPGPQIASALTPALGAPEQGTDPECPNGTASHLRWSGFRIELDGAGDFLGWTSTSGGADEQIVYPKGIGVGDTVVSFTGSFPGSTTTETSLGWELFNEANGYRAFVTGPAPSDAITMIAGGAICTFH